MPATRTLLATLLSLLLATSAWADDTWVLQGEKGPQGDEGAQGSKGLTGDDGQPGAPGAAGANCYDGLADLNGDEVIDVADCRGPQGPSGVPEEAVTGFSSALWCMENCPEAVLGDCRIFTCDGQAQTCEVAGSRDGACAADESCSADTGECQWDGIVCNGRQCPVHPLGWPAACNAQAHCEYTPADDPATAEDETLRAEIFAWPGFFDMGSPEGEAGRAADEGPVHRVTVPDGFFIAKHPTTVAQHEACEAQGACTTPSTDGWDGAGWGTNRSAGAEDRSEHPQNGLTWVQARDYCRQIGARIPSEAEWEYAASGPVHRKYPWGDSPAPQCSTGIACFNEAGGEAGYGCGDGGTQPVVSGAHGASYLGALHMAGNVWEWCEDCWHASYDGAPSDTSAWTTGCSNASRRVVRGASFEHDGSRLRTAERHNDPPSFRYAIFGARCVRDPL